MAERDSKEVNRRVKGYQILKAIGSGGMGDVFLATHELLERPVAIKRYAPKVGAGEDNADNRERFIREGKALAKLQHHGIVGILDMFEHRGGYYMVMEYVDGFHLGMLVSKGPLPVDVACIIGLKVAEAMEHAHFHRIIHRDIKTTNVMVSRDGQVKLMDFGIAHGEDLEKVTRTGLLVGTPIYLAPEVVAGHESSAQSDIYAWGALMYACLSGRSLFFDAGQENLYFQIMAGKFVPLSKIVQGVPKALRDIVHKSLSREPKKRFRSAAELRQAVDLFMGNLRIWVNHSERLVAYLYNEGLIDKDDSSAWFEVSDFVIRPPVVRRPMKKIILWIILGLCLPVLFGGVIWGMNHVGWLEPFLQLLGIELP